MKICTLLHFYQPPNQQDDILLRIVNESYLPITRGLLNNPKAKIVVNISGCLTEMLMQKGYSEVVDNLKQLAKNGQVEFTGSAKFHAFLPLLPKSEAERQILANDEVNKKYFGDLYAPTGFFSPEMAVSENVLSTVSRLGFKWIATPQLSHPSGKPGINKIYVHKPSQLNLLFRNKRVSSLMLSGVCHDPNDFIKETADLQNEKNYFFAVMDAETFGHHRIGHEKFLFDVLNNDFFEPVLVSQLLTLVESREELDLIRPCTWTNEEQDFWLDKERTDEKSFLLWKDPSNPIHDLQWKLTNLVVNEVNNFSDKDSTSWKSARQKLDSAISSDQYWWASVKPWWSLEMVEQGAFELKSVLSTLNTDSQSMKNAETLYRNILDLAFGWQRSGVIRRKHLENSSTYLRPSLSQRTHDEWFNQLILEFEDEMNLACEKKDFEKAIKWRDAIYKIDLGTDIFDVLHVVDELWSARSLPSVKPFFSFTWEEFSEFSKKHFRGAITKEQFESWKKKTIVQ